MGQNVLGFGLINLPDFGNLADWGIRQEAERIE